MNNNLWIGSYADKKTEEELAQKGCNLSSAINVQKRLLDGLEENNIKFDSLSIFPAISPCIQNVFVHFKLTSRNSQVTDQAINFINFPFIHRFSKLIGLKKKALDWATRVHGNNVVIYSLNSILLLCALFLKKLCGVNVVVIVPDLPEYMNNNTDAIYRFLKKIDRKVIEFCIKRLDKFVLFAEQMKTKLPIGGKPYTVMEGVLNFDERQYITNVEKRYSSDDKIVLLSGNLDVEDGVLKLIELFSKISGEEYQLWISGSGNAVGEIRKAADNDKRIQFFGVIPSYDEFLKVQQRAKVFALMVPPEHPKSAFYFPSKIMEYFLAGGVVLCHKLLCFQEEYDQYLHYFERGNELQNLKTALDMERGKVRTEAIERIPFLICKSQREQAKKIKGLLK